MENTIGLKVNELLNFIGYHVDFRYDELYKYVYRETGAFSSSGVTSFISEIKIWQQEVNNLPEHFNNINLVYDILEIGDTKDYNPQILQITKRDINDIRIALEYIEPFIVGKYVFGEGGEGLNPIPEEKEKGCKLLEPFYEKYKDFAFDVKALHSIGNVYAPNHGRLFYIEELLKLWNEEAEPFMRLFAKTRSVENKDRLTDYLAVEDKASWLKKARTMDNYQRLADFLGREVACKHIKRIPSKNGGGLFNLACAEFPEIFKYEDEKRRRTMRNAVNNAVKKHEGYGDVYLHK